MSVRCAVALYSFSHDPNPHWSRIYASQDEIWAYLRGLADNYQLRDRMRLGVKVTGATWHEDEQRWHVSTESGDEYVAPFVANGVGVLHIPMTARLKGIRAFQGRSFHSADWDYDYDLTGKRVAVIGTGASAIQFVPKIAEQAQKVTVFQRSPAWVLPKADTPIPSWLRWLFAVAPPVMRAYRYGVYWSREFNGFLLGGGSDRLLRSRQRVAEKHLARQVVDPELRRKLTPEDPFGCKRVLMSNEYFPAMARPNVDVVTDAVEQVKASSIVDAAGVEHDIDAIIYGTGFQPTLPKLKIVGRDGHNIWRDWMLDGGGQALRSVMTSGYPNMFFLLGPNSGLAHTSMVFMIESQARFMVEAIKLLDERGANALDPLSDVQERHQEYLQRKLAGGVWNQCGYFLAASTQTIEGTQKLLNRALWPGATWRYWWQTRRVDPQEYLFTELRGISTAEPHPVEVTSGA